MSVRSNELTRIFEPFVTPTKISVFYVHPYSYFCFFLGIYSLTNLYNNIKESTEKSLKLEVFHRIIVFTTDSKALDLLQSYLYSINKWDLTQQEAATLYLLVSTSYQRLGATEEEQYFLIKYLSTFESLTIPDQAMAVATHAAKSAAINYIKSTAGSQKYHVPRLRAVRALANHSQYGRLYELVDIFAHKDLNTFLSWCTTNDNASYLTEQGINKENSIETMRLLTLCSLSSQDKVLSYDMIASALQVSIKYFYIHYTQRESLLYFINFNDIVVEKTESMYIHNIAKDDSLIPR